MLRDRSATRVTRRHVDLLRVASTMCRAS
ncbi:putative leader peptide [Ornithinicoccus halotolerans]